MTQFLKYFSVLPISIFVIGLQITASAQAPAAKAPKYATEYSWSTSPREDLSQPGNKTVDLTSCPAGVKGNEPEYWILISGSGTAEAVKVTGGSCAGDGHPGTLQFTTTSAHRAGYTISSASGGLQEALIAARFVPTNPTGVS